MPQGAGVSPTRRSSYLQRAEGAWKKEIDDENENEKPRKRSRMAKKKTVLTIIGVALRSACI